MGQPTHIAIGIQARSTSKRMPGKVLSKIGDKTVLERVIDAAKSSADYTNFASYKTGNYVQISVLTPYNDPVAEFCRSIGTRCIEGSEDDVLSRYQTLCDAMDAQYIVRLTADCPFVPPAYISKAINTALYNKLDYCSNVDPRFRTAPDGFDVEVISQRAMNWLNINAKDKYEREHVTLKLRSQDKPKEFSVGVIIGPIDISHVKISIDTQEDFKKGVEHFESLEAKLKLAISIYGAKCVHKF